MNWLSSATGFCATRLHILLRREWHLINHKRTERLYGEEGRSLRSLKKRKKRQSHLKGMSDQSERINQHCSIVFVSDNLLNGRRVRALTVVDNFSRERSVMEVDHSHTPNNGSQGRDILLWSEVYHKPNQQTDLLQLINQFRKDCFSSLS